MANNSGGTKGGIDINLAEGAGGGGGRARRASLDLLDPNEEANDTSMMKLAQTAAQRGSARWRF